MTKKVPVPDHPLASLFSFSLKAIKGKKHKIDKKNKNKNKSKNSESSAATSVKEKLASDSIEVCLIGTSTSPTSVADAVFQMDQKMFKSIQAPLSSPISTSSSLCSAFSSPAASVCPAAVKMSSSGSSSSLSSVSCSFSYDEEDEEYEKIVGKYHRGMVNTLYPSSSLFQIPNDSSPVNMDFDDLDDEEELLGLAYVDDEIIQDN